MIRSVSLIMLTIALKKKDITQIACPRFVFIFVLIAFETLPSELIDEYFENI